MLLHVVMFGSMPPPSMAFADDFIGSWNASEARERHGEQTMAACVNIAQRAGITHAKVPAVNDGKATEVAKIFHKATELAKISHPTTTTGSSWSSLEASNVKKGRGPAKKFQEGQG